MLLLSRVYSMMESFQPVSDRNDLVVLAHDRVDVEMLVEDLAQRACVALDIATCSLVEEVALGAIAGAFRPTKAKQEVQQQQGDGALLRPHACMSRKGHDTHPWLADTVSAAATGRVRNSRMDAMASQVDGRYSCMHMR